MMLQVANSNTIIPLLFILIGFSLIVIGMLMMARKHNAVKSESKGILLIGPIPIVWGFSSRVRNIVIVLTLLLFVFTLIIWFY